jgi:DNA (cytosine-5)-methyltransferase 1
LQAKSNGGISLNYLNPIFDGTTIRLPTEVEAERLQGFPDEWTAGLPKSRRYSVLGNAVAIPPVAFIMRRIAKVFRGEM